MPQMPLYGWDHDLGEGIHDHALYVPSISISFPGSQHLHTELRSWSCAKRKRVGSNVSNGRCYLEELANHSPRRKLHGLTFGYSHADRISVLCMTTSSSAGQDTICMCVLAQVYLRVWYGTPSHRCWCKLQKP